MSAFGMITCLHPAPNHAKTRPFGEASAMSLIMSLMPRNILHDHYVLTIVSFR